MTKLFVSRRTRRFLIPDEYDVLIDFEPQNGDTSFNQAQQDATTKGTFKVSAMHVSADEAQTLSESTEKPFASTGANDEEKNIELKTLIEFVERLATGDTYERLIKTGPEYDYEPLESDD